MFKIEEVDILLKSLTTWEHAPTKDGMLGDLMYAMLSGKSDETETRRRIDKTSDEVDRRKEVSAGIRVKLSQIRDKLLEEGKTEILEKGLQ